MPQYLSTDPNAGEPIADAAVPYLSTDPTAGEPIQPQEVPAYARLAAPPEPRSPSLARRIVNAQGDLAVGAVKGAARQPISN
jgi:hypothetical protein